MRVLQLLVTVTLLLCPAMGQRHPYFEDKGTLEWHVSFSAAKVGPKSM